MFVIDFVVCFGDDGYLGCCVFCYFCDFFWLVLMDWCLVCLVWCVEFLYELVL